MSKELQYDLLIIAAEESSSQLLPWFTKAGYTCQTADSGEPALQLLAEYTFSVVISELMRPEVSGLEILKHIGENFEFIPVIIITAAEDRQSAEKAYELGAAGHILKPLHQQEVMSCVRNALRRRELELKNKAYGACLEKIIASRTNEIEGALGSIAALMKKVVTEKNFEIRFHNPELPKCYVELNCQQVGCPCYGQAETRCWQIAGTYCGDETQGQFVKQYGKCAQCPVFAKATAQYGSQIGEHFNNMMNLLALKHQQLADSYQELKRSQEQVIQQEKMATIGQLSAGIAHEINNPVGYVSSNLATVRKYFTKLSEFIALQSDTIKAYEQGSVSPININAEKKRLKINYILEDIEDLSRESLEGCERIRSIIGDLKSFARADDDQPALADIHEVINKTINVIWNEIKYKAKVDKQFGDLPRTTCYANRLSQVFMNLLVNASHAITEQGQITITTWHEAGVIFVTVHDNGGGIPREHLALVFQPFFTTKAKGKGTGLGLSICKEIIEKQQGSITVESTVGAGTTFTVRIPVVPPALVT